MPIRGVIRRAGFDRVTTVAGTLTVGVSLVLVAAGPVYADAVAVSALRASLLDLPPTFTSVHVDTSAPSADYERIDAAITERVEHAIAPTGGELSRRLSSDAYGLVGAAEGSDDSDDSDDLIDLVELRAVGGIEDEATLVSGAWPAASDRDADPERIVEVAVDERVAISLEVDTGDVVELAARRDPDRVIRIAVVGRYSVDDPAAPFWTGDDVLVAALTESSQFRTHVFVADPASVLAVTDRPSVGWFARLDVGETNPDDLEPLRRRAAGLASSIDADLDVLFAGSTRSPVEVETELARVLAGSDLSLTVTRSGVFAITLQLSVLAGYALVLVAGLIAESRAREYDVLRARGASPRQLLGRAAAEAAVLVVPTAMAAPWLAAWFAAAVSRFGPLARTGLSIDPHPVGSAWLAVAVAAAATVALLARPTYRHARAAQQASDGARQSSRSNAQRAGLDIAVAVIAGAAYWQLGALGEERAASIRRFGVDPLLIVAPALGLFAGGFLALRVVPLVALIAERVVSRTRSAVPALAGWQVARRPARYARSALLLIMAVALGVFATTYQTTWEHSQQAQADHRAGADLRVSPNRRTNDSLDDLVLRPAYEQIAGVHTAMPVVHRRGDLPNAELPAAIVVLDAAAAADVVVGGPELADALDSLAAERATLPTVAMPDGTVAVELTVEIVELDTFDDDPPPALDALVVIAVQDRHGLLHRVRAGRVSSGAGTTDLRAELGPDEPPGSPASPLGIVEIELRTQVPTDGSREVLLELDDLAAVAADGSRTRLSTDRWTFGRTTVGPFDELAGLADESSGSDAIAAARIVTGRARFGASATYGIRPSGGAPPSAYGVVVSRAWFEANERRLGDAVGIDALATQSARIVGTIDAFPTIAPGDAFVVLADLPTVQAVTYELGAPLESIDEMWLAIEPASSERGRWVAATLRSEPYEAESVVDRVGLTADLLGDPPAVGMIGALTIGFICAAVLAVVGFLVAAAVSARDRAGEFALLRALGLTARQLAGWTFLEQAALVVLSLVIGTGVGLGLSRLLLPSVSSTAGGGVVYPPVEVVYPWTPIVVAQLVVLAGLVTAVLVINLGLRRLAVARQLRAGAT